MSKRTTVTLDEDLAARLEQEARANGESFRQTLNRVIRHGLHPPRGGKAQRFKVRARRLRPRPGVNFDNIEDLLDQVEGPWRR